MSTPADRPIILAALAAFFITLTLAAPALMGWLQARRFAAADRRAADPVTRAVWLGLGVQLAGIVAWSGLLAALGPEALDVWRTPRWAPLLGALLLGLGLLLSAVAQLQLGGAGRVGMDDRPAELIIGGVFQLVRNPSYTGVLCMLSGLTIAAPSPWTVCFLINTALLLAVRARLEEVELESLHGAAYRSYAARVGRFIPGVGKLRREEPARA